MSRSGARPPRTETRTLSPLLFSYVQQNYVGLLFVFGVAAIAAFGVAGVAVAATFLSKIVGGLSPVSGLGFLVLVALVLRVVWRGRTVRSQRPPDVAAVQLPRTLEVTTVERDLQDLTRALITVLNADIRERRLAFLEAMIAKTIAAMRRIADRYTAEESLVGFYQRREDYLTRHTVEGSTSFTSDRAQLDELASNVIINDGVDREAEPPTAFWTTDTSSLHILLMPVGTPQSFYGLLAVAAGSPLSDADRHAISTMADVLAAAFRAVDS